MELGRVGGKPTETRSSPPFRGIVVEWLPLQGGDGTAPEADAILPELPTPPPPQPSAPVPDLPAPTPPPPMQSTALPPGRRRGVCRYWLPERVFVSKDDLREQIAGPSGSHFAHVLKTHPTVELRIDGQPSTAAPPAHRLHVIVSSEDMESFEAALADVLDLVETVCDMVGEELGMSEDEVDVLIKEIRTEKYVEVDGVRTQLPVSSVAPASTADQAPPALPPKGPPPKAPPLAVPTVQAPVLVPKKEEVVEEGEPEYEVLDEADDPLMAAVAGHQPGDADTEDDAKTEASDAGSAITDISDMDA